MNRGMFAIVSASALVLGLHAAPAFAQHGQGASGHASQGSAHATTTHGSSSHSTTTTTHGSSTHTQSATHGSSTHGSSTHGSSTHAATTHGESGTSHGSSAHNSTVARDSEHSKTSSKTASTSKTATTTSTSSTSTTTGTALTPVQQKLMKNTNLASKLQSRLPAGTNLQTAAAGFRNLGQFVAAVNVSNNLGIPFSQLKTDMVTRNMSLGQSIQDLRPTASSTIEAQHAEFEAQELITQTTTTTTTTTTSTSTSTSKPKKHGGDR